jgi:hypothetical protein
VNALTNVATALGLVTACLVLALVGLYALQLCVRILRHWDTSKAPPALKRGSLLGQELELGLESSEDDRKALVGLEQRLDALEHVQHMMLFILKRLERRSKE